MNKQPQLYVVLYEVTGVRFDGDDSHHRYQIKCIATSVYEVLNEVRIRVQAHFDVAQITSYKVRRRDPLLLPVVLSNEEVDPDEEVDAGQWAQWDMQ